MTGASSGSRSTGPVRVFLSYAQEDAGLRGELVKHLATLKRRGVISVWNEGMIAGGEYVRQEIDRRLADAEVVLLLLSADFLASNECIDEQVRQALAREAAGRARVLPIVGRSCMWRPSCLDHLTALPRGGEAVTSRTDRDKAWTEVAEGIAEAVAELGAGTAARGGAAVLWTKPPSPIYPNREVEALAEDIEADRARERALRNEGYVEAADEARKRIVEKRRKLREGGLIEGDALGEGRYRVLEKIGKGGFASVWKAWDRVLERMVAIKVLHANLAGDPVRRERFFRGARVMTELDHEGVARVMVPHGEDGAVLYFVMELVDGMDLQHAVMAKRVGGEGVLPLMLRVCDALGAAHERGIVHRDVKPANILIDGNGAVKLTDFDLVAVGDTTGGTRTGALGTFIYAAPETMDRPQDADARADVFGLAMTIVFGLYGRALPMAAFRHTERFVDELQCSGAVKEVLKRAVDWDREKRFGDARELGEALDRARKAKIGAPARVTPARSIPAAVGRLSTKQDGWFEGADAIGRQAVLAVGGVEQRMRWIPPGRFMMGSRANEEGRFDNEGPQHEVELTQGFWLGETPCTQALWEVVMGTNPSDFKGPDRPVEQVSWKECEAFMRAIEAKIRGARVRFPTEAEWEYACRAGTSTARYGELDDIAWYDDNAGGSTHPVGQKKANRFGLYDMLGNVWEWCDDGPRVYTADKVRDPRGLNGLSRVRRGGSWFGAAKYVRAACRYAVSATARYGLLGFRLVRGQ